MRTIGTTYSDCFDEWWEMWEPVVWEHSFRQWLSRQTFECSECDEEFTVSDPAAIQEHDVMLCARCKRAPGR